MAPISLRNPAMPYMAAVSALGLRELVEAGRSLEWDFLAGFLIVPSDASGAFAKDRYHSQRFPRYSVLASKACCICSMVPRLQGLECGTALIPS
jgi:hypothetical protein